MSNDDAALVPEILGWKWKTLEGRRWLCPPDTASTCVAAVSPEAAQITVDDMLAYLRGRIDVIKPVAGDGWTVVLWSANDMTYTAPTLHEALAAAVVAVAEREEPTNE